MVDDLKNKVLKMNLLLTLQQFESGTCGKCVASGCSLLYIKVVDSGCDHPDLYVKELDTEETVAVYHVEQLRSYGQMEYLYIVGFGFYYRVLCGSSAWYRLSLHPYNPRSLQSKAISLFEISPEFNVLYSSNFLRLHHYFEEVEDIFNPSSRSFFDKLFLYYATNFNGDVDLRSIKNANKGIATHGAGLYSTDMTDIFETAVRELGGVVLRSKCDETSVSRFMQSHYTNEQVRMSKTSLTPRLELMAVVNFKTGIEKGWYGDVKE